MSVQLRLKLQIISSCDVIFISTCHIVIVYFYTNQAYLGKVVVYIHLDDYLRGGVEVLNGD